jgi:hypothetical protein
VPEIKGYSKEPVYIPGSLLLNADPVIVHIELYRFVIHLVVHFLALFNPVSQIKILQTQSFSFFNQPENGVHP